MNYESVRDHYSRHVSETRNPFHVKIIKPNMLMENIVLEGKYFWQWRCKHDFIVKILLSYSKNILILLSLSNKITDQSAISTWCWSTTLGGLQSRTLQNSTVLINIFHYLSHIRFIFVWYDFQLKFLIKNTKYLLLWKNK